MLFPSNQNWRTKSQYVQINIGEAQYRSYRCGEIECKVKDHVPKDKGILHDARIRDKVYLEGRGLLKP